MVEIKDIFGHRRGMIGVSNPLRNSASSSAARFGSGRVTFISSALV